MIEAEETVNKMIDDVAESFFKKNNISTGDDDYTVCVYQVGNMGYFYLISYKNEIIGSVLQFNNEVVSSSYPTANDKKMFN